MALFQTSVLKKFLHLQNKDSIATAYKDYSRYFLDVTIQENIKSSKEEEYQGIFLTELFAKVLGYTMKPNANFNLVAEYKNQTNSRKADGAILKDDLAIGVIELKGTNTKDLESIRKQAFDYKANQKGCVYVITSNFEKLRFYINDATEFLEFDLFGLTEEKFTLLYLCLQQENLIHNLPLEIKEASLVVEEQITKGFYKDYSVFKRELYRDLVRNNLKKIKSVKEGELAEALDSKQTEIAQLEKNVKLTLFKKSQKLIDRFLFIFFAEDRGLLPPNAILQIIEDWNKLKDLDVNQPLYERFKLYFSYLDTGRKGTATKAEIFAYNGGLFKPDAVLDLLEINDELLYKHTAKLSKYDFESQVDVNILGHIFENSLNEIESINAEIEGDDFDKQKSKRKKDGVFYTPKYITKYIVENTIGKLCEEKKSKLNFHEEEYFEVKKGTRTATKKKLLATLDTYRDWLLQLTICDPACGSGAFLNQALEFLIAEHAYIDELKAKVLGGAIVFSDIENTILENNIYGVDINEESVEIAKLSLWLRTAQPRRKLNDLSSNIKCGNSLIEAKSVAGDKAFKWEKEFPDIFAKGGFDVVIGNPPYLSTKEIDHKSKEFFKSQFHTAIGQFDLYGLFIEKSFGILKNKGLFSFITSNTFLSNKDFIALRKLLLSQTQINSLVNLGETVFDDANLDVAILGFKKVINSEGSIEIIKNRKDFDENQISLVKQKFFWNELNNYEFKINCQERDFTLLEKLFKNTEILDTILDLPRGIEIGGNSDKITETLLPNYERLLVGRDISRYGYSLSNRFIKFENNISVFKNKEIYLEPKILIQRIRNLSMRRRIIATYDNNSILCTNTLRIGILKNEKYNLKFLLAILNSSTINYIFLKFFLNKDIYAYQLKTIPIKFVKPEGQRLFADRVDILINFNKEFSSKTDKFQNYLLSQFSVKKLSKKLQNWHELEFGDFIKELNKAINKENRERRKNEETELSKLTKKDEFEWMELFESKKKEAQELQTQIQQTEKQIDQMVYELYGLTEEEIEIVENN